MGCAHEDNAEGFDCWWAHSEEEMKTAFEDFIDWTYARWEQDNEMHVYHYGQFEITAIRSSWVICVAEKLDNLEK